MGWPLISEPQLCCSVSQIVMHSWGCTGWTLKASRCGLIIMQGLSWAILPPWMLVIFCDRWVGGWEMETLRFFWNSNSEYKYMHSIEFAWCWIIKFWKLNCILIAVYKWETLINTTLMTLNMEENIHRNMAQVTFVWKMAKSLWIAFNFHAWAIGMYSTVLVI